MLIVFVDSLTKELHSDLKRVAHLKTLFQIPTDTLNSCEKMLVGWMGSSMLNVCGIM